MSSEKNQSVKGAGKVTQLCFQKTTVQQIKESPGFEEYTEAEIEEYLEALEQFCILGFHLLTAQKEDNYEFRKAV